MGAEVLGIDLGKTVCSHAGLETTRAIVYRKRLQRHRLLDFLEGVDPCIVAKEACGCAHHIGRFCLQHGHEPRLMSPLYVRPYVKFHKNDDLIAAVTGQSPAMVPHYTKKLRQPIRAVQAQQLRS